MRPLRIPRATLGGLLLVAGCLNDDPVGLNLNVNSNPYTRAHTRWFYIAADEVAWDYAPLGYNAVTGQPFDDVANVFVQSGPDRIGDTFR